MAFLDPGCDPTAALGRWPRHATISSSVSLRIARASRMSWAGGAKRMAADHILAIDNGTQSVRALLFDPQGNLISKTLVPLAPYFSVQPGWAEQRPGYYWESLCQACQQLWRQTDLP